MSQLKQIGAMTRLNIRLQLTDPAPTLILTVIPLVLIPFMMPAFKSMLLADGYTGVTGAEQAVPSIAMHRLRGPKQGYGPQGAGAGTPLAVHLQRNDVTHMVGMAVRQGQRIQVTRAQVRPQRPKGPRTQVTHERKHAFPARLRVDAARLNEVGGCGGLGPRHRACRTDDGQLHATPPPVLTRTTDPTSGPRNRLARRGKASDAPVSRN